jgi:aquaporin Z
MRHHWPEYLMEAWGLGTFMLVAGTAVTLLEAPGAPLHQLVASPELRRALIGLAMGVTAVAIIYSPWGRQSGAHLNPAVTLAFLYLGRIAPWDALLYVVAQFAGGAVGIGLVQLLLGPAFAAPPVSHIVTVPGTAGPLTAFIAEMLIAFGLMFTVLRFIGHARLQRYTGLAAGVLITLYITIEAPLSGMSMNPARTLASALPAGIWTGAWIYFSAPLLGMLAAAAMQRQIHATAPCAKLCHARDKRCIHCGYQPASDTAPGVRHA